MKTTLAVIVGYITWSVIWLGGNAVFRAMALTPPDQAVRIEDFRALVALLVLSIVASGVSGYVTHVISSAKVASYACLGLLLVTGIFVQWSIRSLLPPWYHVAFLLLLAPVFLLASRIARHP